MSPWGSRAVEINQPGPRADGSQMWSWSAVFSFGAFIFEISSPDFLASALKGDVFLLSQSVLPTAGHGGPQGDPSHRARLPSSPPWREPAGHRLGRGAGTQAWPSHILAAALGVNLPPLSWMPGPAEAATDTREVLSDQGLGGGGGAHVTSLSVLAQLLALSRTPGTRPPRLLEAPPGPAQ